MTLKRMDRGEFARTAELLATMYNLVYYQDNFYIPKDLVTDQNGLPGPTSVWLPQSPAQLFKFANDQGNILFEVDAHRRSFLLILEQFSQQVYEPVHEVLVRRNGTLGLLNGTTVSATTGDFVPNYVQFPVGDDVAEIDWVFNQIVEWVGSEDDAHSLLHHMSTILSPGWSAGKLVLLIGSGSNGKSTLLKMVERLLGRYNISNVTRQMMSERSPAVHEINGKLLNLVFDGERAYLKDSSAEKTLLVGEPLGVRMLYSSQLTTVQSNCLFMEGLNSEPKAGDKSFALQRRISRYRFDNTYVDDEGFLARCLSDQTLSALLALLVQHHVKPEEKADKLKSTTAGDALSVDYNLLNSPVHQFVDHLVRLDADWIDKFEVGKLDLQPLLAAFMAWRTTEGMQSISTADAARMFREEFDMYTTTRRVSGKPQKYTAIKSMKKDMAALLNTLKG